MNSKKDSRLSRRDFLKSGSLILTNLLVYPILKPVDPLNILAPDDRKRIYIAPDDHTDYFWAGSEEQYRQAFLSMIDYYLDLADKYSSNPTEFQSRWNCDGSFWLWVYENNKTAAEFQRLIDRIRDGHISFPLTPLVLCQGGAPAEAVLRGMYYAGSIERRYNLRVRLAVAMENQTLPYGLGMLWAGSGAKYSWRGICGCDSQVPGAWDREKEIYWWEGMDGSRILMKWQSMLGNMPGVIAAQSIGGYAEARNPADVVEYVDKDPLFQARYPYTIIGAFGNGWDDLQTYTEEFVTTAIAKTNPNRLVLVSNEQDFFEDFENTYGPGLSSQSCSFGNEWDLYVASLAEVSASVKRSVEKLRSAEALAALVSLQKAGFMSRRAEDRKRAWIDLGLYWEHNFGMVNPLSGLVNERIAWDRRLASEIRNYVDGLQADAVQALGGMVQKTGNALRFFVFNPLNWERTDTADIPYTGPALVHVVDLNTAQEAPSQIVTVNGQQYLRILATSVPPIGYKVFEIQQGAGASFPNAAAVNGNVFENDSYRVAVAPNGAITSLRDKQRSNREFVRNIDGRSVNDLGPDAGSPPQVENAGPVSVTLRVDASGPVQHTTRITLFLSVNRVEIVNEILQNFDNIITWSFGFELNDPDVWHEEVGAVIRAKLVSQGGHYSDRARNSRYDWLTLNHFADVSSGSLGITLSNADCYFMQLGRSTVNSLDTSTPKISVLAGGRVANGFNGLPGQGGDTQFLQRFALQTHADFSPVAAMKFALEHQNPLVIGMVSGGNIYPEKSYSFLSISNPDLLLWALKPADDGPIQNMVARLWNLTANTANFTLATTPGKIASAEQVSHIETPIAQANVSAGALAETLDAHQMKSFSVQLDVSSPPGVSHVFLPLVDS